MDDTTRKALVQALLNIPKPLIDALSISRLITTDNEEYDAIRALEQGLLIVERK